MSSSRATLQELFDQAIARHQGGDLAGAEHLYQQVLLMEPNSFAPRHMLGVVRFQQGRAPEAIDLITGALRLNPQVADAWINLGHVQASLGRVEEIIDEYVRLDLDGIFLRRSILPGSSGARARQCGQRAQHAAQ